MTALWIVVASLNSYSIGFGAAAFRDRAIDVAMVSWSVASLCLVHAVILGLELRR